MCSSFSRILITVQNLYFERTKMNKSRASDWICKRMDQALQSRREKGLLRQLQWSSPPVEGNSVRDQNSNTTTTAATSPTVDAATTPPVIVDFASNDYLGLAHDYDQHKFVEEEYQKAVAVSCSHGRTQQRPQALLGATGSRLLSGDNVQFHQLEEYLTKVHHCSAALLFNSGYDANLSIVSCLPCDIILYDEYVHNSLHMGMRLWQKNIDHKVHGELEDGGGVEMIQRQTVQFLHNNVGDMNQKLHHLHETHPRGRVVILVESVYSMDGDIAPLKDILNVAELMGAEVVVDEAHGLGVYGWSHNRSNPTFDGDGDNDDGGGGGDSKTVLFRGTGVLAGEALEKHPALLCAIYTFGKAAGCHGAVVAFSVSSHKQYLCNYGYPFIYSTALPLHSIVAIRCAYETMTTNHKGSQLRKKVFRRVHLFRSLLRALCDSPFKIQQRRRVVYLLPSESPIQAIMIPGNQSCTEFCTHLFALSKGSIRLFPIKSPTVPIGQERVRIILHAHNTDEQVKWLCNLIQLTLKQMNMISSEQSRL